MLLLLMMKHSWNSVNDFVLILKMVTIVMIMVIIIVIFLYRFICLLYILYTNFHMYIIYAIIFYLYSYSRWKSWFSWSEWWREINIIKDISRWDRTNNRWYFKIINKFKNSIFKTRIYWNIKFTKYIKRWIIIIIYWRN